jgi:tetratricopeptide (TPR) repeat protein
LLPERLPLRDESHRDRPWISQEARIETHARSLEALGKYQEAADVAQKGVDLHPDSWSFWTNRGKPLAEMGKYAEAEDCFRRAIEAGLPNDRETARAWTNLAFAQCQQDRIEAALTSAQRAVEADATFPEAWMALGACQRHLHQHHAALTSLQRGAVLAPNDFKFHHGLANCLSDLGRRDDALTSYMRAVELNPDVAECWYQIATIRLTNERFEEARRAIDRCLELDETNADAWILRCTTFWWGSADMDNARRCFEQALALRPNCDKAKSVFADLLAERGSEFKDADRHAEALADLEEAARLKPQSAKTWFDIAWIYSMQEEWSKARAAMDEYLVLDTPVADAWVLAAMIHIQLSDHERGRFCLERALELQPDNAMAIQLGNELHDTCSADEVFRRPL